MELGMHWCSALQLPQYAHGIEKPPPMIWPAGIWRSLRNRGFWSVRTRLFPQPNVPNHCNLAMYCWSMWMSQGLAGFQKWG